MKTLTLAALAALVPLSALAHDGLRVNDAYARSTNPAIGAIFLTLENHRQVGCTLRSLESDVAERVEIHTHLEQDGVMRMTRITEGITVPAGAAHAFSRGGDHIMLLGLTRALSDGDTIDLMLDFGDCGTEQAQAVVDNQRIDDGGHGSPGQGAHIGH